MIFSKKMRIANKIALCVLALSTLPFAGCKKETSSSDIVRIRWAVDPAPSRKDEIEGFYKENPNEKIQVDLDVGGAPVNKMLTQIAGGEPADVFAIYYPSNFQIFAEKGVLLELTPYMKKYNINMDDFWPAARSNMEYDGKVYALSSGIGCYVLFYNKKMFKEAGLKEPDSSWTWKELREAAIKLSQKDPASGRYTRFGLQSEDPMIFIWQNGGSLYSKDGKKCVINSPEAKQALRWYYDLRFKERGMPTLEDTQNMAATGGWGGTLNLFAAQKVAMLISGRWLIMVFRKDKNLEWNIAPLPKGKERVTFLGHKVYAIPKNAKNPEAAFKFLNYLVSNNNQLMIAKLGDAVPTRISGGKSKDFLHNPEFPTEDRNQVYLDQMQYARPPEFSPYFNQIEVDKIWSEQMGRCLAKLQEPEATLEMIAQKVNALPRKTPTPAQAGK